MAGETVDKDLPRWPVGRTVAMLAAMTVAIAVLVVVTDRFSPRDRTPANPKTLPASSPSPAAPPAGATLGS